VRAHERSDPEFAAQLKEAEEEGAQLLHAVCWKAAIEGNVEPIHWLGQIVREGPELRQPVADRDAAGAHAGQVQDAGAKVSIRECCGERRVGLSQ
jgi:hypothetical protein